MKSFVKICGAIMALSLLFTAGIMLAMIIAAGAVLALIVKLVSVVINHHRIKQAQRPAVIDCDYADEIEQIEEDADDEDIDEAYEGMNIKKQIEREERRLSVLYNRMDKLEYINKTSDEEWQKFKASKTYRGLEWDIRDAEATIDRLKRAAGQFCGH